MRVKIDVHKVSPIHARRLLKTDLQAAQKMASQGARNSMSSGVRFSTLKRLGRAHQAYEFF
jgi:hypothetical protein